MALVLDHKLDLDKMLGKLGITQVKHMWDGATNTWKEYTERMTRLKGVPQWLHDLPSGFLATIHKASSTIEDSLVNPDLWIWSNDLPMGKSFMLPNS